MFVEPYQLRLMTEADVPSVMNIEKTAYPFPWTEGNLRDCLKRHYYACVLEVGANICGYALMSMAAGEAHVLNICIQPDLQGKGLGRTLLHSLEQTARENKVEMLLLEVRASNKRAIKLYESLGFNELGCREHYYPGRNGREDALVLARQLSYCGHNTTFGNGPIL